MLPFLPLFQLSKPGRLDTDNVPTLQNTANIMDFVFDPFNNNRLVVGKSFNILVVYCSLQDVVSCTLLVVYCSLQDVNHQ